MTVKELLTNISFDELLPILKKYATDHIHDIYIFREVYDILKNIEPNDDYHDEVIVYYNVMLEYRSLIISNIKSSAWDTYSGAYPFTFRQVLRGSKHTIKA